jgi:hypothetical protein
MDPNLLRGSENIEDRRDEAPLTDWWRLQHRDLPNDPNAILRMATPPSDNPYNQFVGTPQAQQFAVGRPQSFYDRLQNLYGQQPGAVRPDDRREFAPPEEVPWEAQVDQEGIPGREETGGFESQASSDQPFTIHSPTKITLSPVAKEWAQQHGMTLEDMARFLLRQEQQRQSGNAQRQGEN